MIMELTTTSLGLATATIGASVLAGSSSEMDSYRKFFLSERSDIDKIIENSRNFENEYSISDIGKTNPVEDVIDGGGDDGEPEKTGSAAILGTTASVVTDGIRSYLNYRYLLIVAIVGAVLKFFGKDSKKIGG